MGRGFLLLTEVPAIDTRESAILEFKNERPPKATAFEAAKDVSAMANAQGGTILLGAVEGKGRLARFDPITLTEEVSALKRFYEEAVRDRCAPQPTIDHEVFDVDGGQLLAIHIAPSPYPIAVRVKADKSDGHGGDAWVFFKRAATHNLPVRPEVICPELLPVFMSPDIRAVGIILRNIKRPSQIRLKEDYGQGPANPFVEGRPYSVLDVDELANAVTFYENEDRKGGCVSIPLNFIKTVYRTETGVWQVLSRSRVYT